MTHTTKHLVFETRRARAVGSGCDVLVTIRPVERREQAAAGQARPAAASAGEIESCFQASERDG